MMRTSRIAALAFVLTTALAAQNVNVRTFTYKRVGDLEIKLDAHRLADDTVRPLAVYIHGGALIGGGRQNIGPVGRQLIEAGYCLVSIDYRLAPETKLPLIIQDVEDAFKWLRENGREQLRVDPSRIAVLGGSAGGYLTLTAGFRVKPRPTVLVSFWGYGEVTSSWYANPSPHPRHLRSLMTDEQMAEVEAGAPVSNSQDRVKSAGAYYSMTRRLGVWAIKVAGCDPVKEFNRFVPYMALYNVTTDYPPTMFIHGTEDTDVPFEQSRVMARELTRYRVPHELIAVEGAEHDLQGHNPQEVAAAYARVLPFLDKYMKAPPEGTAK